MKYSKTLIAASLIAFAGTAATAGGHVASETGPAVVSPAPAGAAINPSYIVIGVLTALIAAASAESSSSSSTN